jgi:hypothetical protein
MEHSERNGGSVEILRFQGGSPISIKDRVILALMDKL